MAPVDPSVLLNTIVYLLDINGGLKSDRIVRQFITLMKLAEKLVNKAIYLQILSHTKSEEILITFLKSDGHQILIKWLSYFSSEHNHAFLLDTLNVLGHLPFNIDNISQNDIDELQLKIAELASAESGEEKDIRESARHLYDIWSSKGIFKPINTHTSQVDIDERTFSQLPSTSQSLISNDKHPLTSQKLNQNERTLLSSNNNTSSFNDRKMATTATLTAVSTAGTNNNSSSSSNISSSTDSIKRKSEENIGPLTNRKPTHRRITTQLQTTDSTKMKTSTDIDDSDGLNKTNSLNRSTTMPFRIPKIGRPNVSVPSPPSEMNDSSPPPTPTATQPIKSGVTLNRQTSDELNSQQGKRKFSLSQYKERKRLKSSELQQDSLADTDMRINHMGNSKASPPMCIDDEPLNASDSQSIVSPTPDEINKDTVIKSNLSEPG
ncbi:unnamed protein product, partial [Adineta steineri]